MKEQMNQMNHSFRKKELPQLYVSRVYKLLARDWIDQSSPIFSPCSSCQTVHVHVRLTFSLCDCDWVWDVRASPGECRSESGRVSVQWAPRPPSPSRPSSPAAPAAPASDAAHQMIHFSFVSWTLAWHIIMPMYSLVDPNSKMYFYFFCIP